MDRNVLYAFIIFILILKRLLCHQISSSKEMGRCFLDIPVLITRYRNGIDRIVGSPYNTF